MPINITGSWVLSGGLTGSLYGTASFSDFAQSASYFSGSITNAVSSSYALTSTSATSASRVTILSDTSNQTNYIPFVNVTSGTDTLKIAGGTSTLTYNPSNNSITASNFKGTSSFAVTASYAIASTGLSNPYTGSAGIYGALTIQQTTSNTPFVISGSSGYYPRAVIHGNNSISDGGGVLCFTKPYAFTTLPDNLIIGGITFGESFNTQQHGAIWTYKKGSNRSRMEFYSSADLGADIKLVSGSVIELYKDTIISSYKVLTLTPTHPLRTSDVPTGSFAVSGSPPIPYFWDGITWNPLY